MSDWTEATLWKTLSARPSLNPRVDVAIKAFMPMIQVVLNKGNTSPLDFTLHDADHAFRVAERMVEITPEDVLPKLGDYEIALLLFSAYLHDIGMTPERGKVEQIRKFVLTGETPSTAHEVDELKRWVIDHGHARDLPLPDSIPLSERLPQADMITTYFSRHKHNDWSEEWIRANLDDSKLLLYPGWLNDLVRICRSHHEDYEALVSPPFDPRLAGSPAQIIHTRYLSMLLRVADVLDIDPERTPQVILRHRAIKPSSRIYWAKDRLITLTKHDRKIILQARPESARIERAIRDTKQQIETELLLCHRLATDKPLSVGPAGQALPHAWNLEPVVNESIQPEPGTYEYIDGTFRPDAKRVLELLSGTDLYRDGRDSVRELLQNAFDAVKEQIAYERLERSGLEDPQLAQDLGKLYTVELRVEKHDSTFWLICTDDGVGMTKRIIRDQLLVSGSAQNYDRVRLEHRCEQAGFNLGRTGQFGIGVLSYFIIADRIEIKTLRSQQAGDADNTGWLFITEGLESFGELRSLDALQRGTEVRLELKDWGLYDSLEESFKHFYQEVSKLLTKIPCNLRISSNFPGVSAVFIPCGWVLEPKKQDHLEQMWPFSILPVKHAGAPLWPALLTDDDRQQEMEKMKATEEAKVDFLKGCMDSLRLSPALEGKLPDGVGSYRLQIPYFDRPDGVSLAFVGGTRCGDNIELQWGPTYPFTLPAPFHEISWKGMTTPSPKESHGISPASLVWIWIDWEKDSVGDISLDRHSLSLTEAGNKSRDYVHAEAVKLLQEFVAQHRDSTYNCLNSRLAELDHPASHWVMERESERLLAAIPYPVNSGHFEVANGYRLVNEISLVHTGEYSVAMAGYEERNREIAWTHSVGLPHRFVLRDGFLERELVPQWTSGSRAAATKFPPGWKMFAAVEIRSRTRRDSQVTVWNAENPVSQGTVERFDQSNSWEAFLAARDDLLTDAAKIAGLLKVLLWPGGWGQRYWKGLIERDPSFVAEIWVSLFGKEGQGKPLFLQREANCLVEVSPTTWTERPYAHTDSYAWLNTIPSFFPDPGDDWKIPGSNPPVPWDFRVPEDAPPAGPTFDK